MRDEQKMVKEFMDVAYSKGAALQLVPLSITMPTVEVRKLRVKLIAEELIELATAYGLELVIEYHGGTCEVVVQEDNLLDPNTREALDAVADLKYVVEGTGCAMGVDTAPLFDEVHRSNMSKFIDGKVGPTGKWKKGPSYKAPDFCKLGVIQSIGEAIGVERELFRKFEDNNEKIAAEVKKVEDLNEKINPVDSSKVFKMAIIFFALFFSLFAKAQLPPPTYFTDWCKWTFTNACHPGGISAINYNTSSNMPWANGIEAPCFSINGLLCATSDTCITISWSWGGGTATNVTTNFCLPPNTASYTLCPYFIPHPGPGRYIPWVATDSYWHELQNGGIADGSSGDQIQVFDTLEHVLSHHVDHYFDYDWGYVNYTNYSYYGHPVGITNLGSQAFFRAVRTNANWNGTNPPVLYIYNIFGTNW